MLFPLFFFFFLFLFVTFICIFLRLSHRDGYYRLLRILLDNFFSVFRLFLLKGSLAVTLKIICYEAKAIDARKTIVTVKPNDRLQLFESKYFVLSGVNLAPSACPINLRLSIQQGDFEPHNYR